MILFLFQQIRIICTDNYPTFRWLSLQMKFLLYNNNGEKMKKKEDLRIIKTKRHLYEGLLTLMQNEPFEQIKVSDICKVSLVNRSTFYDHFNDKYELLLDLMKDLETELKMKLKENQECNTAKEYYMEIITILFEHISEHISTYTAIIKNNNNTIANDMLKDVIMHDVESYLEDHKKYKGKIPTQIITQFYVSAVIEVCLSYIKEPTKYKKEDILSYLNELLPNQIY